MLANPGWLIGILIATLSEALMLTVEQGEHGGQLDSHRTDNRHSIIFMLEESELKTFHLLSPEPFQDCLTAGHWTGVAASRPATGSISSALDEEVRQHETRRDIFLTIAQSVDSVVASFDGRRKQIAKEATAYVVQDLGKLIKSETGSIDARSWAAVAASATVDNPTAWPALTCPRVPLPSQNRPSLGGAEGGPPFLKNSDASDVGGGIYEL
ncbi:hypothetical protein LX32DRAFT_656591 [Colletotrichum zoysiae]|uniref:Uncharacterized protein n=1 Tax=Colletotrichum zoysiae TaxID=1216348 RepID=A0AAD9H805_9PEZI|nr:hypothetical protein LX32DRAFT_656591 [Colletotrichum zoysiae]